MKKTFIARAVAVIGVAGISTLSACHKTASPPATGEGAGLMKAASLLIGTLSKNTATVVRLYPGPDGLVGVIFKNPSGSLRIVWMTPHGAAILPGPVITAAGQDLTRIAQQAIDAVSKTAAVKPSGFAIEPGATRNPVLSDRTSSPAPSAEPGKKMSDDDFLLMSKHLKSVSIGRGAREIWIYFDPNCIFCNRLWEELKPYEKDVTAHWIPVGFLRMPDSSRMAGGILQAKSPVRALEENEDRFDSGSEEGGFPVPSPGTLDLSTKRSVAANTVGLNQAVGELATPTIVYRGVDGKPQSLMGLPGDLRTFLERVKK